MKKETIIKISLLVVATIAIAVGVIYKNDNKRNLKETNQILRKINSGKQKKGKGDRDHGQKLDEI